MSKQSSINRRDFLKLAGAGVGAAILVSCKKSVDLTAVSDAGETPVSGAGVTVVPEAGATPFPSGTTADTILTNGRIMTVDAANSISEAIATRRRGCQPGDGGAEYGNLGDGADMGILFIPSHAITIRRPRTGDGGGTGSWPARLVFCG